MKKLTEEWLMAAEDDLRVIERIGLDKDLTHIEIDADLLVLQMLDKLYVDARYPGNLGLLPNGMPSLAYAEKFNSFARAVFKQIKSSMERKRQKD